MWCQHSILGEILVRSTAEHTHAPVRALFALEFLIYAIIIVIIM